MKRIGDRKDGTLIRDLDALHFITGVLYPERCNNEAFIEQLFDLTKTNEYLAKKNAENPDYKYNVFQIFVCAMLKVIYLREKMNRFIVDDNFYQRKYISASFVVKKEFNDKAEEGLAIVYAEADDNIDTIHEKIKQQVKKNRGSEKDQSSLSMDVVTKLPRFIGKFICHFSMLLDHFGLVPSFLIKTDPYYSSVVLTNLGSIKLDSGYHHLTNWGTNSVFISIGRKMLRPFYDEQGNVTMKDSIDIGLTIDERLADGYYYSKSVKLLKTLVENPELLEKNLNEEVEY